MRLPPFSLLLAVCSGSLAALARPKAVSLGLTLGVVPVMSAWHASGGPASPFGSDLPDDVTTAIILAVLVLPVVLIVAMGGVEQLKRRRHDRRPGSKPHNKS